MYTKEIVLNTIARDLVILIVVVDSRSRAWFDKKPYNISLGANVIVLAGEGFSTAYSFDRTSSKLVGISN